MRVRQDMAERPAYLAPAYPTCTLNALITVRNDGFAGSLTRSRKVSLPFARSKTATANSVLQWRDTYRMPSTWAGCACTAAAHIWGTS